MMKHSFLTSMLLLLLASCTTESRYDEPNQPNTPDNTHDAGRQEVLLTLNNKLSLQPFGRAIATTEENTISSLDVYVFGSAEENGTYTYQQRFSYRSDEALTATSKAPWEGAAAEAAGIEELQLSESADGDRNTTTGLLSLKRGLFVKLYCIANDTLPVNPVTGKAMKAKDFIPIKFNNADGKMSIASVGVPMEQDFLKFRTALLEGGKAADAKGEVLLTPLAMSGAMTTPLDLTDPTNSSRLQTRLRLTRLAARFDIVNDAQTSRFTIRSVSMGNARRGASFFPITVHGDTPAKDGELVTLTPRTFSNETGTAGGTGTTTSVPNANQGLSTGAFYSYPSPQADGGYLILKGLYQVNQTEQKEVTYQVPFHQSNASGENTETYLDINNNHRYTLAITRADDYHLDFTLNVTDWTDDGSIDDYHPENKPGEITIKIPDAFIGDTEDDYDPVRKIHTVSMSLKPGSTFDAFIGTTSPLTVSKTYAGGVAGRKYDWLQIDEPLITRIATSTYQYTFSLKPGYILGRYPRATVRIFDALSGSESILFVEALAVPQPIDTPQPPKAPNGSSDNPNSFDADALVASLYRITDSQTDVRISCPDGLEVQDVPAWLEAEPKEQAGAETLYTFTLKDREVEEPGARVVFCNKKRPELKAEVGIELKDASIQPSFDWVGTDNKYTAPDPADPDALGTVDMKITDGNTCSVNATSMDGVAVKIEYPGGSPEWLSHDGMPAVPGAKSAKSVTATAMNAAKNATARNAAGTTPETITFSLVNNKLAGAQPATVTLVNRIGGPDYRFTIAPQLQLGTVEKASSIPMDDNIAANGNTITLYKLPGGKASSMDVKVTSYGGSTLKSSDDAVVKVTKSVTPRTAGTGVTQDSNEAWYTLTALSAGTLTAPRTATLTHGNRTDATKKEEYTVNVIASDITGDETATLLPENGKTAKFLISSPLGFKAAVTDYKVSEGGKLWLKLNATEYAGKENTEVIVTANSELTNVRPVTLTLTNNIADGGNKTLTVTPVCAIPALSVVAKSANPTANSLEGTQGANVKLKLIRIANSTIKLKATAIGGTKITDIRGVTVTNADGSYATSNEYQITLASATTAGGSFKVVNRQDATKVTTVTVEAPLPDIKANNLSVNAANNATTNIPVNSYAGLTASVTSWGSGGQAWFDITTNKVGGGDQNVVIRQKADLSAIVMKPATIKLANSLAGGTDKTITVTPNLSAPTVAKTGTPSPSQNTMSGNTINLYRVNNSALSIVSTIPGSSQILSSSNVTVTGAGTAASPYQVKLNNTNVTSGSFVVANKSDNSKRTTITVTGLSADITVSNVNLTVTAANSGSTNFGNISSPEGCTVSVLNNNWNGGGQWFDFAKSNVEKGSNKMFTITQRDNVNTTMKSVTIRLTNNIAGGPNKDITLTPTGFVAPTLTAVATDIGQPVNVNSNFNGTLTVTVAGGFELVSNSNSAVATVSANGTTYTIAPLTKGSTTLTFRNKSDYSKTATKTFTVAYPTFNGGPIFKTTQAEGGIYYIAMQDAAVRVKWSTNLNATYCANKPGGNWYVPSDAECRQILGGTSGENEASAAVFDELTNNGVFSIGSNYWTSSEYNSSDAYNLSFYYGSPAFVQKSRSKTNSYKVRCVSRP